MKSMHISRRHLLGAATGAALPSSAAEERYQLGCQTLPYRAESFDRALQGIRRAGYRYVMPFSTHQGKAVFTPALSPAARAELRRKITDAGLTPFMCFVGLGSEIRKPEGSDAYRAELDLAADFGIRTVVGVGPWYFTKFPNVPKRARDWRQEVDAYYKALEPLVRHAGSAGITITLKPHTGITATAAACLQVMERIVSPHLKICWDAGNVSFYEGIYPDPDLPDLAPHVKAVCLKDHRGGRAESNFPVPGQGQIDHEEMFRILFGAGFRGPLAVERVDGNDRPNALTAEVIDQRIAAARTNLEPLLEKAARA